MRIVISPYHLTTREPPALAALLLAEQVVTLLPAPLDGRGDAASASAAAMRVPTYRAFAQSWAWTAPLWKHGLLHATIEGDSPASDMYNVGQKIASEQPLSPLRYFARDELYDDERTYLGALAADVLKGGPDPGISVPVAAGLDRFAARHGLMVARSAPSSVAQRAENALAVSSKTRIVPMLMQASAMRLLHARMVLDDVLQEVWKCLDEAQDVSSEAVHAAFDAYAAAFESRRPEILEGSREDEVKVIEGAASITWMVLPGDAVLRSSLLAMATLTPLARGTSTQMLPVVHDRLDATPIMSMVVKPLGFSVR